MSHCREEYAQMLDDLRAIIVEELNKRQPTIRIGGTTDGAAFATINNGFSAGCNHQYELIESTVPYYQCKFCYQRRPY